MKEALKDIFNKRKFELTGVVILVLSILTELSFFTEVGVIGEAMASSLEILFGTGRYAIPAFIFIWGLSVIYRAEVKLQMSSQYIGVFILFFAFLLYSHLGVEVQQEIKVALAGEQGGGVVGGFFLYLLRQGFGDLGSKIILAAIVLVGSLLLTDVLLANVIDWVRKQYQSLKEWLGQQKDKLGAKKKKLVTKIKQSTQTKSTTAKSQTWFKKIVNYFKIDDKEKNDTAQVNSVSEVKQAHKQVAASQPAKSNSNQEEGLVTKKQSTKQDKKQTKKQTKRQPKKKSKKQKAQQLQIVDQATASEEYQLPPLSLLNQVQNKTAQFVDKTDILQQTLDNFGVEAEITDVHWGPTITRYEIEPAPGVKVSKIVNLADDIALSLAASDVRIEAPIPGKAAVGIEVPNDEQTLVTLREVLETEKFQTADSKLTIGLGNNIAGQPATADLTEMPHMLVAGATGSGKSVFINSIINSILHKATPEEVKFLLIDPKMVELNAYQGIPHLVSPVVTDPQKAATALRWVVKEMEKRYELFASSGARGIESYNEKSDQDPMPYIVVIIDELADLMMVSANEVEDAICRLAQKARAAGIHMILATQRPSVDVVTGVIKANIPTRVSFSLSSQADSRTILDTGGAEKLLGQGDMLFAPVGSNQPTRLQGAFISEAEIKRTVEFVKQQDQPDYAEQIADIKDDQVEIELDDEQDELYEKAVQLVVNNRASISFLQRKLSIGYNRAARMIDQMEEENIVGPHRGSKARKVLISKEELDEILD